MKHYINETHIPQKESGGTGIRTHYIPKKILLRISLLTGTSISTIYRFPLNDSLMTSREPSKCQ